MAMGRFFVRAWRFAKRCHGGRARVPGGWPEEAGSEGIQSMNANSGDKLGVKWKTLAHWLRFEIKPIKQIVLAVALSF
jgi:hypothetical protein